MRIILEFVLRNFAGYFEVESTSYDESNDSDRDLLVSSILEVSPVPSLEEEKESKKLLNVYNTKMSNTGKDIIDGFNATMMSDLKNFFDVLVSFGSKRFLDIPSDTKLVILKREKLKNGTNSYILVSTQAIKCGTVITAVPFTTANMIAKNHMCIWVGDVRGFIIRKCIPFGGFGGFAKWTPTEEESNCVMKTMKGNVVLVSRRDIKIDEKIICLSYGLMEPCLRPEVKKGAQSLLHCFEGKCI